MPSMIWSHFEVTQNSPTREPFWQAAAYYHSQLPKLVKSGLMGYYNISSVSPFEPTTPLNLAGGVWILNTSVSSFNAIMDPVLDHIQATYPVNITRSSRYFPNFYDWWKVYSPPGAAAADDQIANRLIDEKALSIPLTKIADYLKVAYGDLIMISNLVSGPGTWNARPAGGLGAMSPAWRKTIVEISTSEKFPLFPSIPSFLIAHTHTHTTLSSPVRCATATSPPYIYLARVEKINPTDSQPPSPVVPAPFAAHNATQKAEQNYLLTNKYMKTLRTWAADMRSYLNEADVNEPDLPGAYWGKENHKKLVEIKRKWDPEDVFWCAPCVGGERWKDDGRGRLCRV